MPGALVAGARIGRYEIVGPIAVGGMGTVYRARDVDLGRTVAIKVVRSDRVRSSSLLLREAQAMARLSHPNVVVVYEVGPLEGEIFVAMEFVDGFTLRKWLAVKPRDWREIVSAFTSAGRGLAAAHAAGIVHRDFKPDNVLVGHDGRVRVTDFGLAGEPSRSTGSRLEDSGDDIGERDTVRFSRIAGGTPAYMAPEQHLRASIDARADQYAFCVSLHEALYGKRPFEAGSARELRRLALERKITEVPREPRVPSWLRAVILRGLAREVDDRFESMDDVVAELARDRATGRRRLAIAVGAVAAVTVAALAVLRPAHRPCDPGSMTGVWDEPVRARVHDALAATGRAYAEDTFQKVSAALDARTGAWNAMSREVCLAAESKPETAAARRRCLDDELGAMRGLTGLLAAGPDAKILDRAVAATDGLEPVSRCADTAKPLPADPRVVSLRSRLRAARSLFLTGKYQAARPVLEAFVIEARDLGNAPLLAEALLRSGEALRGLDDARSAQARFEEAVEAAARGNDAATLAVAQGSLASLLARDASHVTEGLALLPSLRVAAANVGEADLETQYHIALSTAVVLGSAGRYDESVAACRHASDLAERAFGPNHSELVTVHNSLAVNLRRNGKKQEALDIFLTTRADAIRILGRDHPWVAGVTLNVCSSQRDANLLEDALASCRDALAGFERSQGPEASDTARALNNTGQVLLELGRFDEALADFQRAAAIKEKTLGPEHRDVATSLLNVATLFHTLGRDSEALALAERTEAIREKVLGPDHRDLSQSLLLLADVRAALGMLPEARHAAERALAIAAKVPGSLDTPNLETVLAQIALLEGHATEALAAVDRVIAACRKLPDTELLIARAGAREVRGKALMALGRPREAVAEFQTALDRRLPSSAHSVGALHFELARAEWASGVRDPALVLAKQAVVELERDKRPDGDVRAWLAGKRP